MLETSFINSVELTPEGRAGRRRRPQCEFNKNNEKVSLLNFSRLETLHLTIGFALSEWSKTFLKALQKSKKTFFSGKAYLCNSNLAKTAMHSEVFFYLFLWPYLKSNFLVK